MSGFSKRQPSSLLLAWLDQGKEVKHVPQGHSTSQQSEQLMGDTSPQVGPICSASQYLLDLVEAFVVL